MYICGSFHAFIVKPTIMPDFARNLLHYSRGNVGREGLRVIRWEQTLDKVYDVS